MRWFDEHWTPDNIATWLKTRAAMGSFDGETRLDNKVYIKACTATHQPTGSVLIFTRDKGMHSSGWWKNPDYEQCHHLSLSFRDPATGRPRSRDKEQTRIWLDAFFGPLKRLLWTEPPYTPEGKAADVYHFRLFFAPGWRVPISPRDEVYTKTHTPAEWLSWSDARAKLELEAIEAEERAHD